ncbi:MAG: PIN domain-containing protein [Bacteroidota bacterium]
MKHLFLDTNVIIDVMANREPFSNVAARLLNYGDKGKLNIYISALSYSNIYYILRKTCSHKQMISLLKDIQAISTTIDVTAGIISNALDSGLKDFEDAIQLNTARSNKKIQAIVTRDPKGFRNSDISVLTPEEALSIIESSGS